MPTTPVIVKIARPPFSKPQPGCPINWAHWLTRGLVASWPLNEGVGDTYHEYASGHEHYALTPKNYTTKPSWTTNDKVLAVKMNSPALGGLIGSAYYTDDSTATGFPNLPQIDFTHGFTIHLWLQLESSGVDCVWFSIGNRTGDQHVCSVSVESSAGSYYLKVYMGNGPTFTTCDSSATPWATISEIPNQFVVSVAADPNAATWVLNVWDATGAHLIQDFAGTGTLQNFGQYSFNGFILGTTV